MHEKQRITFPCEFTFYTTLVFQTCLDYKRRSFTQKKPSKCNASAFTSFTRRVYSVFYASLIFSFHFTPTLLQHCSLDGLAMHTSRHSHPCYFSFDLMQFVTPQNRICIDKKILNKDCIPSIQYAFFFTLLSFFLKEILRL